MKLKINRNTIWAEAFVNELVSCGIKYASLSPGSRNTPLTLAFAGNKKIKSFVHVDERSSGFFALGLAKSINSPVAVVCTSGTATAELYPAIIEAYQQRVPLIICTADRPAELRGRGANQTINQNNMYKNHIRWFYDTGLPAPVYKDIASLKAATRLAVNKCMLIAKGPVHINFPFKKPFEPNTFTDEVDEKSLVFNKEAIFKGNSLLKDKNIQYSKRPWFNNIYKLVTLKVNGIIICGPGNFSREFIKECNDLSDKLHYPIFADGTSQLRFGLHNKSNIVTNFDSMLRSSNFSKKLQPEVIIQFGRTVISKGLETFLKTSQAERYMFNEFGDWFDPAGKAKAAYKCEPQQFCKEMNNVLDLKKFNRKLTDWQSFILNAEEKSSKIRNNIINKASFLNECRVIEEILEAVPNDSNIMLSNSMPIRDFDYFASKKDKIINVYNNRGASGIDGISSTAFGISAAYNKPTILLTGDLAFYYDLNSLLISKKIKSSLTIVLVNNNGGGIFEVLPISSYGKIFKDYFVVPHKLNFSKLVNAYGGNFYSAKNWLQFRKIFNQSTKKKTLTVIEIKTNAVQSLKLRRKFWNKVDISLSGN